MARLLCSGAIAWFARLLPTPYRLAWVPAHRTEHAARALPASPGDTQSPPAHGALGRAGLVTPYHYKASGSTGALHESSQVRITILPEVATTYLPGLSPGCARQRAFAPMATVRPSVGRRSRVNGTWRVRASCSTIL